MTENFDSQQNIEGGTKPTTIITGIRPSANLTLANLVGSVMPMLELQKRDVPIFAFVATLHGLTDNEPKDVIPQVNEVARDYLALGLDPKKVTIFDQRTVRREVALLKLYLERHLTISRMVRVPTLKEKLRSGQTPEQANALLAGYPIMMAADILLQDSTHVPVGKDQFPHMEVTKELARAFNTKYGDILVVPEILNQEVPINILSLRGNGKMSKSNPDDAIFLTDDETTIKRKLKRAETANPGQESEKIDSLVFLGKTLSPEKSSEIDDIIAKHKAGEKVMVALKDLLTKIVVEFNTNFQNKREGISANQVEEILASGGEAALKRACAVITRVEKALSIS